MNHSAVYPLAVFVHLLGGMAFVALAGFEWATLHRLRREPEPRQVLATLATFGKGQRLVSFGVPLLLLSGLYLVWAAWAWTTPWILAGLVSMAAIGFLGGGVTGRHVGALLAAEGADLQAHLPTLWTAFLVRVALLLGTVFLMCAKPGPVGSVATLAGAVLAGLLLARGKAAPAAPGDPRMPEA